MGVGKSWSRGLPASPLAVMHPPSKVLSPIRQSPAGCGVRMEPKPPVLADGGHAVTNAELCELFIGCAWLLRYLGAVRVDLSTTPHVCSCITTTIRWVLSRLSAQF